MHGYRWELFKISWKFFEWPDPDEVRIIRKNLTQKKNPVSILFVSVHHKLFVILFTGIIIANLVNLLTEFSPRQLFIK